MLDNNTPFSYLSIMLNNLNFSIKKIHLILYSQIIIHVIGASVLIAPCCLYSQNNGLSEYPMYNLQNIVENSSFTIFPEGSISIDKNKTITNTSAEDLGTPVESLITLFGITKLSTYKSMLYSSKKETKLTQKYFDDYSNERKNIDITASSSLVTKIRGTKVAFVKYKILKSGRKPVIGCYAFGLRDRKWLLLNNHKLNHVNIAITHLKNSTLSSLANSKVDNIFQKKLLESVSDSNGLNIDWLSDYINNLVFNKESRKEEFDVLCTNPNWKKK
jgi:hypothetical protein